MGFHLSNGTSVSTQVLEVSRLHVSYLLNLSALAVGHPVLVERDRDQALRLVRRGVVQSMIDVNLVVLQDALVQRVVPRVLKTLQRIAHF